MHARLRTILAIILAVHLSASAWAADGNKLTAKEAALHIGENATVCGTVASAKFSSRTKGQPTFLNLDEPYPRQIFTALIWGSDRPAFGAPEVTYAGKRICVTGMIKEYRGSPEIVVKNPRQIRFDE